MIGCERQTQLALILTGSYEIDWVLSYINLRWI